jgi:hypothetical protein
MEHGEVGCVATWGGCTRFDIERLRASDLTFFGFGGVLCAILGTILGAVIDHAKK